MVLLSAMPNLNFIPTNGPLDQLFHQTWLQFAILGLPHNGYKLNLIQLIIILIIALAANAITERLAGRKAGGLLLATLITVLGAALVEAYVTLPFDFALEGCASSRRCSVPSSSPSSGVSCVGGPRTSNRAPQAMVGARAAFATQRVAKPQLG